MKFLTPVLQGVRGSYEYLLMVGGSPYSMDEIPNTLSITSSCSADGYTVGICSSSTISGTLPYKFGSTQRNSPVLLYENNVLIGQWFLSSCEVIDEKIIKFSANDAMAFADNPYPMEDSSIGAQIEAAQTAIASISGVEITIDKPSNLNLSTNSESGWMVRDLLSYTSMLEAANYWAVPKSQYSSTYKKVSGDYLSVSKDEYSSVTVGESDSQISRVRVFQNDCDIPAKLEVITGEPNEGGSYNPEDVFIDKLEYHGIYEFYGDIQPQEATTLKLINPLAVYGSGIKDNTSLAGLVGKSYGTPFSCENVRVGRFLPPLCQLQFETLPNKVCYVSSANYKLTSDGLYASVSGGGRNLSDYLYAGKTEKEMRTKLKLGKYYGNMAVSDAEGAYWDDRLIGEGERIDNG